MKKIIVSVPRQELTLLDGSRIEKRFPISTSKFGLGSEEGSFKTPLGTFRICEKYGAQARPGTVFKGRKPVGHMDELQPPPSDCVSSRILRLEDEEAEINHTYQRYIYLHGTNEENLIGRPASHGCIRLTNKDIVELYPKVPVGTQVLITNE